MPAKRDEAARAGRTTFGSSGIRGPWGTVATPELALALGRALGARRRRVLVGHDARLSSPALEHALVAGLLSSGAEVARAGLAPTPAIAFAGRAYDASVVITASHNPAPDNGFKLWNPDGRAFDADERAEMEAALDAAPPALAEWNELRTATFAPDVVASHAAAIRERVGPLARRLRVVLDCGNGAGSVETPALLAALGCDVVTLNAQPDGRFPGRASEPSEENLRELVATVRASGADLGLAHDGDADRCVAVADDGRYVTGDELLCLLATRETRTRAAVPVDASLAVEDVLAARGASVVRTRVGDAYVSEACAAHHCEFGGEASGAWIFPSFSYCPDGPLAAATVCAIVAREGPLGKLVAALPRYPILRVARPVAEAHKAAVLSSATARLSELGSVTRLDGVRVETSDGWVLVRASGTEPKIRVTAEARRESDAKRLLAAGLAALDAAVAAVR
ncbi:MAG: phosphoglucosamine mutase [Thermoplasmatota archaeon]